MYENRVHMAQFDTTHHCCPGESLPLKLLQGLQRAPCQLGFSTGFVHLAGCWLQDRHPCCDLAPPRFIFVADLSQPLHSFGQRISDVCSPFRFPFRCSSLHFDSHSIKGGPRYAFQALLWSELCRLDRCRTGYRAAGRVGDVSSN